MEFLKRILGICETRTPLDPDCWRVEDGAITVDLRKLPEIRKPGRAIRFEGKQLPVRVLLAHTLDGQWRAYQNRCTHMGRRLDYVPESGNLRCCSISKSLFRSSGDLIEGPAKRPIPWLPVEVSAESLRILLDRA